MIFPSTVTLDILNNKNEEIFKILVKNADCTQTRGRNLMIPSPGSHNGFATPTLGRVIRQDISNPANFLSKTSLPQVLDQALREDAPGGPTHKQERIVQI